MSKDRPELLGTRAANSEADEAAAKTHPQKEVSSAAPPPAPESAEEFHKAHCGIAIPLYAVLDENRQGRQPTKEEILSKVYEFAEAYAAHLQAELERLRKALEEIAQKAGDRLADAELVLNYWGAAEDNVIREWILNRANKALVPK